MVNSASIPLVMTIRERCRVCYTCVRECPAKAIQIAGGQAEVVPERCIGCGNCVRVCSQNAKHVLDSTDAVFNLLNSGADVAACIAPSFPAEFAEVDYQRIVGMIRALGFRYVNEVAFGADLVAREYRKLLSQADGKRYVATTCPAIVGYIERYHPEFVDSLAPIVSPMLAMARVLHHLHGPDLKVVFIGPCIAKKGEASSASTRQDIDAVLTFVELRRMFEEKNITPDSVEPDEFDLPHAGKGALFPISRGLLQAAGINEDLISGDVVVAEGRSEFVESIKEFESGDLDARLLEVLCCDGCIMGPGMSRQTPPFSSRSYGALTSAAVHHRSESPLFTRRSRVSRFVRQRSANNCSQTLEDGQDRFADLDLGRDFHPYDQRIPIPSHDEVSQIMARMGKTKPEDELNCGACGYETCREHAIAIYRGLAENEMCLPYIIDQLRRTVKDLALSHEQLARAQEALMQAEKLASMGQLAAGVAHEVNNPLGVVLMYAHILLEECDSKSPLRKDLSMIADQADRCKKIVSGLLNFARQNKVVLQPCDLSQIVDSTLKAMPIPDNIELRIVHDSGDTTAELDREPIVQVLVNLVTNAMDAMPQGGILTVRTSGDEDTVTVIVEDIGVGIPPENRKRIFEPFFTTKQMGKGTGLGLAVTYGIVKMHRGDIQVVSNTNRDAGPTGTTFTVTLPRWGLQNNHA